MAFADFWPHCLPAHSQPQPQRALLERIARAKAFADGRKVKAEQTKREAMLQLSVSSKQYYSIRTAKISLPSILTSIPSGGRKSEPCTMAPRTQTLPGRLVNFVGSNTVWLHGLPTIGCLAAA